MVDYQNAKIYKLWSPSQNLVYIGSTTQKLSQRKTKHVSDFKSWQNGKKNFVTSFTILECEDNRIELIENYPCNSREELLKREGYYIKELDCVNKCVSGRTQKEYREEHKEELAKKHKEWRQNNKEEILKKKKEYYQDNKEELAKKHKEYRNEHKEELAKKNKEYRIDNKEEISKRGKEKITCECGSILRKTDLERHKRSKRHLYFLEHGKFPEIKAKEKITCDCGSIVTKPKLERHKKTKKHLTFVESQKEEKEYTTIIFID